MCDSVCPFCKRDPYEYVDVGIGMVPVAVTCCDLGYQLLASKSGGKFARKLLALRRSHSPRKKARYKRIMKSLPY